LNNLKKETGRGRRTLALTLYLLGLLLMLAVAGITIFPESEVSVFDRPLVTEETLGTLRCPPAVTPHEDGVIKATFTNDQDRDVRFRARARISYYSATWFEDFDRWVELAPGETKVVTWALEPERAAFGWMILARVHVSRRANTPPQQRGCGVMVLNLPLLTGTQYVLGMAVAGLLSLAASGFVWLDGRRPVQGWRERRTRHLALVAAAVAAGMVAGLLNLWAVGGLLLLFSVLLLISLSQYHASA
jgi:hypothetical protein